MIARPTCKTLLLTLTLFAALATVGCPKKPVPAEPPPPPAAPPAEEKPLPMVEVPREPEITRQPPQPVETEQMDDVMRAQNENRTYLKTVYFEFDKYDLKDEALATLKGNAIWIKAHPGFRIVVEGHCDERGTIEYNLELGAKRAKSVLDYLGSLGADTGRMRTISYGEERPVDMGHDESAWGKNRRAEFTLEK